MRKSIRKALFGTALATLLVILTAVSGGVVSVKAESLLQLTTDKSIYALGEEVRITLENIGDTYVSIGGWPCVEIYTYPDLENVWPYYFAFLLWELAPGESETWTWNQYNAITGAPPQPGMYVVKDNQGWGLSAYFQIATTEEQWIPYVPEPWQWWPEEWSLLYWEKEGISYINATLVFPDSGYMVTDWGTVVQDGNAIWVDSEIWDWTGAACLVITTLRYTYDLGKLENGTYTFTLKVWGYAVKSISFETGSTRVLSSTPDLSITSIVLPYTSRFVYAKRPPSMIPYNLSVTVANQGTADAGSFNVSFTVHLKGEIIPEYGGRKTVESLQQGAETTFAFDFNPQYYGNYTLTITVDSDSDIVELDETNNSETLWLIGTIRCDNDCDGDVDYSDFITFAGDYGRRWTSPPYRPTDADWDGDVDFDDFIWFAWNYGQHI